MNYSKKFIFMITTFLFLSFTLVSCSYESTVVDLNSLWTSTWNFNTSSNYEFDENYIEVINGKASLKILDLEHSGADFNNGSHAGTEVSLVGGVSIIKSSAEILDVSKLLPERANDLIGYWKLDEIIATSISSGDDYEDFSGNNQHGTRNGSFAYDSGLISQAADFDGTTEIEITGPLVSSALTELTVSCWFYISDLLTYSEAGDVTKRNGCIADWNNFNVKNGFNLGVFPHLSGNIILSFSVGDGTNITSAAAPLIPDAEFEQNYTNRWVHFLGTFKGGVTKVYVDGVLNGTNTSSFVTSYEPQASTPIYIGRSDVNTGKINGKIDEIAIWKKELSENEVRILHLYQSQHLNSLSSSWTPKYENIVGYWKMDGNWQDASGAGNHGLRNGGFPVYSVDKIVGSNSTIFDGVDDNISIADNDILDPTEISISMWIKSNSTNLQQGFIGKGSTTSYRVDILNDNRLRFYDQGLGNYINSTAVIEQNKWYHISVVGSVDGLSMYINGSLNAENSEPYSGANTTSALVIGNYANNNVAPFNGVIDDVAIWNTALVGSDINIIYNRQKQKYAGHFDSEVIDLGSITAVWPDLSWSTSLPFAKELVGDFNDDGSADIESSSEYSGLSGDLSDGLVGYWSFNALAWSGITDEVIDLSGMNNHGVRQFDAQTTTTGKFNSGAIFDGDSDRLIIDNDPSLNFSTDSNFSMLSWFNVSTLDTENQFIINNNWRYTLYITASGFLRAYLHDGVNFCVIEGGSTIELNKWIQTAVVVNRSSTCDKTNFKLFINGQEDLTANIVSTSGNLDMDISSPANLIIGSSTVANQSFNGVIDETAIWNRNLTEAEIQQLYRRGANRVKLQVKSCVDSTCECESFNAAPVGSSSDCDGDGIINTLDSDDIYKSEFIGPGGDGTTYYSENFNREATEITFDCALNISDSNPGVCAADEVIMTAGPKPTGPEFLNIDYTQFVKPPANQFIQYRVYMEADDNTACDGDPCLPELTSVNLNPTDITKYTGGPVEIKPTSSITYSVLKSVTIDADACATYQLSSDGINYFYWDGITWAAVVAASDQTTKLDFENHITDFAIQFGPGQLFIKSFLQSNPEQTANCIINDINVDYSN